MKGQAMEESLLKHLRRWIDFTFRHEQRNEVERVMLAYIATDPDAQNGTVRWNDVADRCQAWTCYQRREINPMPLDSLAERNSHRAHLTAKAEQSDHQYAAGDC